MNEGENSRVDTGTSLLFDTDIEKSDKKKKPSVSESIKSSYKEWINGVSQRYIKPILKLGKKRTITTNDLEPLSHHDRASVLLERLFIYDWSITSTWRIIFQAFLRETLCQSLIIVPYVAVRVLQPLILRAIIQQVGIKKGAKFNTGLIVLYTMGLLVCFFGQAILYQQIFLRSTLIGRRINNALTQMIYRHALVLNISSFQTITRAQATNLIVNDVKKFEDFWFHGQFLWGGPLEAIATFALLIWIVGIYPTLCGFFVLLIFMPIQYSFSRFFSRFSQGILAFSDKRINAFSELLGGFLIIKMWNWEKAMEKRIRDLRENELSSIRCSNHLRAVNMSLYLGSTVLVSLITFGSSWLLGYKFKSENVFITFSYFIQLRLTFVTLMTNGIERLGAMLAASDRIDSFMRLDKMRGNKRELQTILTDTLTNGHSIINMRQASYSWGINNPLCIKSVNLKIKPGELIAIVGPVGSGKSSLLSAILGEMNLINGIVHVNGTISYAAQTSWILADTIRANIILGKEFNEQRYKEVVQACCLDVDLKMLGPSADLTVIGDRAINLSGGQRARISLARAVYADADIYLLDDPLAAVDQRVAKQLFDSCIGPNGILKGKTRLLVTHHLQFLPECDRFALMNNGFVEVKETYDELSIDNKQHLTHLNGKVKNDLSIDDVAMLDLSNVNMDKNSILQDETIAHGNVSWSLWLRLFTAPPAGYFGFIILVTLLIIGEVLFDFTNYWLFYWSSRGYLEQRKASYPIMYVILSISTIIACILRAFCWFYVMLEGARHLHDCMLKGILYTSMRFREINPIGRILNRTSRDQQVVDEVIPINLFDSIQGLCVVFGSIIIISVINPYILLLFAPLAIICWYVTYSFLKSAHQLKRLECSARSPIFSLFSSSLEGLTTIRAFQVKDGFLQMLTDRIDSHTRAYNTMVSTIHGFGLKLDIIASIFAFMTIVIIIIMREKFEPLLITISLACSLSLPNRLQWSIRQFAEVNNDMIHVERIYEYTQLPPEEDNGGDEGLIEPPKDWPNSGKVEFQQYTMKYRTELEPVLAHLNLIIKAKEKVGIVGRTGAGKSSLFQGIFRLIHRSTIDGKILIDDVDIARLRLDQLRSCLSIIPQTPVLFGSTLRYNLDPLETCTDEECYAALEAVQLKDRICREQEALYQSVIESGSTFSVGERQLICLARAFLRRSKILLIDEATANIDHETDKIIQKVIMEKFSDRTVLTIAHRLKTVSEYDRILVMEKGHVVTSDIPQNIFQE